MEPFTKTPLLHLLPDFRGLILDAARHTLHLARHFAPEDNVVLGPDFLYSAKVVPYFETTPKGVFYGNFLPHKETLLELNPNWALTDIIPSRYIRPRPVALFVLGQQRKDELDALLLEQESNDLLTHQEMHVGKHTLHIYPTTQFLL